MTIHEELEFLFPSPMPTGVGEISTLSVRQILTFLERSQEPQKLASYLIKEHGQIDTKIVELYKTLSVLLNLPEKEKSSKQKTVNFGDPLRKKKNLSITPNLIAVAKLASLSWNEVLEMPITHYNLLLRQWQSNYEAEKQAYEASRRRKG